MQDESGRTAFTFSPIYKQRTTDATRRITAVGLDTTAARLFLGLASGHVEEHQIVTLQAPVAPGWSSNAPTIGTQHATTTTRLVAEKRISRHAVRAIACLPTAARLAILCEDGTASVASYDSWVVTALQGVRTASAISADPAPALAAALASRTATSSSATPKDTPTNSKGGSGPAAAPTAPSTASPGPRPVRLAVAVNSITTPAKLLVYSIAPSIGFAANQPPAHLLAQIALPDPVSGLIWVGTGLIAQHPTRYSLVQPGGRFTEIAAHGCRDPKMASLLGPGPAASAPQPTGASPPAAAAAAAAALKGGALLFQDSMLLLTDASGAAAGEPIVLPEPPLAVASSGPYVVTVTDGEGVVVYDASTCRVVQRLYWAHDDPWVAAERRLPAAEDAAGGGGVVLAAAGSVLLLKPLAPDVQIRELLKRKRFDAALALIASCRAAAAAGGGGGSPPSPLLLTHGSLGGDTEWLDTALVQAGLLMLQELRCEEGLAALAEAGPARFQPAQLLPLFPGLAARWLAAVPRRSYWGLHGGALPSLERICEDFLELRSSTGSSTPVRPSPPPSVHGGPHGGGSSEPRGAEVAALAEDAKRHVVHYLLEMRRRYGGPASAGVLLLPEALDTLTALLLLELGDTARLEAFLGQEGEQGEQQRQGQQAHGQGQGQHGRLDGAAAAAAAGGPGAGGQEAVGGGWKAQVSARDPAIVGALESAGRYHALALLRATHGSAAQALELWHRLARGELQEAPSRSGAVARAAAAAHGPYSTPASPAPPSLPPSVAAAVATPFSHQSPNPQHHHRPRPSPLDVPSSLPPPSPDPADPAFFGPDADLGLGLAVPRPSPEAWAAATAAVAAASAAALMANPARTPPLLCLSKLTWLLQAAPEHALHVLRSRPLPVAEVLSLLLARSDGVRWQYLHHLVYGGGGSTGQQHGRGGTAAAREGGASSSEAASEAGSGAEGGGGSGSLTAEGPGGSGCSPTHSSAATSSSGPAAARTAWHLDPSLHTELACELVECVALVHVRQEQMRRAQYDSLRRLGRREAGGADGDQDAGEAPHGQREGQGQALRQTGHTDSNVGPAATPFSAAAAQVHTASYGAVQLPLPEVQAEYELLPRLPSLGSSLLTSLSGPHPARAGSGSRGPSPMLPHHHQQQQQQGQHLGWRRSSTPPPHGHTYAQQHHSDHHPSAHGPLHHMQNPHNHTAEAHQRAQLLSPNAHRTTPAASTFSTAQRAIAVADGGGPAGAQGGGGATATADLPWLATIGLLSDAAAVRQLQVAVRGAVAAAGGDPDAVKPGGAPAAGAAGAGTAAAVGGWLPGSLPLLRALSRDGDGAGICTEAGLRSVLQHHLYCSTLYDAAIVLRAVTAAVADSATATVTAAPQQLLPDPRHDPQARPQQDGSDQSQSHGPGLEPQQQHLQPHPGAQPQDGPQPPQLPQLPHVFQPQPLSLHREAVLLHSRLGDHAGALRGLALGLGDVDAAISYCRSRCGQEGWLALLDLLLRPGDGRQPDYGAACRVLAAEGAALAPLQVLGALSDDMPLHLAHDTLGRMVGSVLHRKRHGQVLRALHRAQNLALRATLAELQAHRVVVNEESTCRGCQRPLSTRVFYRYPSGVVLCARCARPGEAKVLSPTLSEEMY